MRYDWIFFDLDNTLMDFSNAARKAFSSSFQDFGLKEENGHHEIFEHVNHTVWRDFEEGKLDAQLLRRKRFDDFFLRAAIRGVDGFEFNAVYLDYIIEYSTMLKGSIDLLDHLEDDMHMAIITNGLQEVQRPRIKRLNIEKYFSTIVVSDEEGVAKPHKSYFDIVMERCKKPNKDKILVVGDNLHSDMKGGIDYGLDTCWCNLSKLDNHTKVNPDFEIHDLHQIKEIINL